MGNLDKTASNIWLKIPFSRFVIITVSLPSLSLFYCFWSAFLFRNDEVNDTDCNVTNNIPSASAITGIRPQAYIWRICIGLHSAPRFVVGFMYYNYYNLSVPHIRQRYRRLYVFLMNLCFWMYTVECACLLAVSCISNRENYPLHEKIFVGFMTMSIAHMVFGTILYRWSRYKSMTEKEKKSFFWKKMMLAWIILSTVGLIVFFVQHRFYCIPGAFSIFSIFEYMIAYANIGYHATAHYEFSHKYLIAADLPDTCHTNGTLVQETRHIQNGHRKME